MEEKDLDREEARFDEDLTSGGIESTRTSNWRKKVVRKPLFAADRREEEFSMQLPLMKLVFGLVCLLSLLLSLQQVGEAGFEPT